MFLFKLILRLYLIGGVLAMIYKTHPVKNFWEVLLAAILLFLFWYWPKFRSWRGVVIFLATGFVITVMNTFIW
jgi:hypothetical protein